MQVENQALQIRQAAKAGLMKKYNFGRDTVDYLDASGKLDEVIKAHETQALQQVTECRNWTGFAASRYYGQEDRRRWRSCR